MAPGKLTTRVIQSSNEPAAESEVINRGSCVWSLHRKDEWSATAAVTSLNITHGCTHAPNGQKDGICQECAFREDRPSHRLTHHVMHLETRPSGKTQISFGTFCRSHADTFVLILREGFLAFCVSNVHWLARLFHTQTHMRLHTHTYTPRLAQQVRMFHKLRPAHQGYVCVHYHWCWVRVC